MKQLLMPLEHSKLRLRNRLVMPPMATYKGDGDGQITDDLLRYYEEKSRGGHLSLVISEHFYVNAQGKANTRQPSAAEDGAVESLRKLAALLHLNQVKAAVQISHAGSASIGDRIGPSAVPHPLGQAIPAAMTEAQIEQVISEFARAAARVKQAGFDAVEIHSAHGYLLNQFYSPLTNRRTDKYGGSLADRIRIHLEIVQAVRGAVGEAFPILLRLGGCDYMEGGSTIEDSVAAARELEKAGVDLLDISGGFCRYANPKSTEPGYFSDMSTAIKKAVSIPVLLTGGVNHAQEAEELLERGAADLIGVGRAILNDSDWPAKAMKALA